LVHTGKIIYFLSGTNYFCRYFSNTQENYEKKSTWQNLPPVRTSGAKQKTQKESGLVSSAKRKKRGPQLIRDPVTQANKKIKNSQEIYPCPHREGVCGPVRPRLQFASSRLPFRASSFSRVHAPPVRRPSPTRTAWPRVARVLGCQASRSPSCRASRRRPPQTPSFRPKAAAHTPTATFEVLSSSSVSTTAVFMGSSIPRPTR